MSAALTINKMYVMPLNKLLGYRNVVSLPFYFLQDALYNQGLKYIPEDDGEREMWWFAIRYVEYDEIVAPDIYKRKSNKYNKQIIKRYENWTNEVYSHIVPFATLKIKDKTFKRQRFGLFIDVVYEYNLGRNIYLGNSLNLPTLVSVTPEELTRKRTVLKTILDSIEYTKKYEPEGWDHLMNHTKRYNYPDKVIYAISEFLISYESDHKIISCNSILIKLFSESKINLAHYYYDKNLPARERKSLNWLVNSFDPRVYELILKCPDNKYLNDLKPMVDEYSLKKAKKELCKKGELKCN